MSLHGLLAADLALDKKSKFAAWNAMFPTLASFEASTPLMWPAELQTLLTKPAKDLLRKQQAKFQRDWDMISTAFPDISQERYIYSWLLVNTRTFYYTTPRMERLPHHDRMALQPVADLLNHADTGCQVSFSPDSFTITADRMYRAGEEVHICYGGHSNDFLLTEYGFVLVENRWDEVCFDDVILPSLNKEQKADLHARAFLGKYMLDAETIGCYRTQVVLRLLCCTHRQWQRFVNAEDDGEASQSQVDVLLKQFLDRFAKTIQQTLESIEKLDVGQESQREILSRRWKQVETMVTQAIERLNI